jgi:TonB-linked SusC/RagA family outer membrane protein
MKINNNKLHHKILSVGAVFAMLASTTLVMAQDNTSDSIKRRTVKTTPAYQMKEVSGYVYDASTKLPIDGARVQAYNNAKYSVLTDEKGKYTLSVPVFVNSLYVTVPEYNDVQVAFSGAEAPAAVLYSDKYNSFYSVETGLTASKKVQIENSSAITIDSEIENKLGGDVRTINRNGMQGQGAAMFIRGLNSLNTTAQPLIVLDGMMMDMQLDRTSIHDGFFNNVLAGIDVEDIESVEVLKNGTSLYGARGGNGVIIINTKRGHSMATRINVSVFGGFETVPSAIKMMDAGQYKNYTSELIGTTKAGQNSTSANYLYPFLNDDPNYYWYPMYHNNTDWSDGLYQTAFSQNYKVNVQGGDDIAMYSLSLGYTSAESTAKNNGVDRLNIRFNTDINLLPSLKTQLDVSYSRVIYDLRNNGWAENYSDGAISSPNVLGLIQAPFLSKYAYYTGEDGKLHESGVYAGKDVEDDNYPFAFASAFGANAALANPYWILKNGDGINKNTHELTQFNLNVMPKWEINKHLNITNRFAYQLNRSNEKLYLPEYGMPIYNLEGYGDVTSVIKSLFGKETVLSNDFRINWSNNYGAHDVAAYGGFRFVSNSFDDNYMSGYNSGNDKMPDFKNSTAFRSVNGTIDSWRNMAYYANARYSYKNTYFLEGAVTAEASSRFGAEAKEGLDMFGVKWGLFPSVQAAWVLSNEKWLAKAKGVNYLKLTAGYDESGNDNVDYSASRTYFKSQSFLKTATGLQLANIENPEIQWETTHRWNFGLSGSFFKNRIQAGVDYYISETDNLLTLKSVNYMSGLKHYWCNEGALRNTGFDVRVNAIVLDTKNFKWQIGATVGHYKNEVTSLPENDYTTTIYGAEVLTSVGNPVGLFYGYKTDGVFSTDAEAKSAGKNGDYLKYPTGIKSNPYKNFRDGDVHFVDVDDNGVIDAKDKTVIGDPNPDVYGNIYTNLAYKRWSLDINFKYSLGNDVYNYQRSQLESMNGFYNQTQAVVNRWTCEGQQTDMPRVCSTTSDNWVNNERFSDRWIEDGSYLKLKNVRLSYELPLNLSWIQGLTIWGEANNLFVLTKYTGKDPEFSCGNSVLYQGIDAGLLPQNRSFNLGVKINL